MSDGTPVRVVHVITGLDVGGAELMLARLLAAIDPMRVENVVISLTDRGALADRFVKLNVPVYALGMRSWRSTIAGLTTLIGLLRRLAPDVVQTWLYHADFFGSIAGKIARAPKIAWNVRCSELNPRDQPRLTSMLLRVLPSLSRWPAVVVCNSEAGLRAHQRLGYRPQSWALIPNGVDTDVFRPSRADRAAVRRELGVADDEPLIGMAARLHPMKNHAGFLQAAAQVAVKRRDARFLVMGRGVAASERLIQIAAELGLGGRVHLLDERSDPAAMFAALDVAVSSSSYGEGFPNVIAEAMACSVPCVATDVGDSAAIMGAAGIIVAPGDPGALAIALVRVLAMEPASRKALGQSGRDRIVSEYSLGHVADRYERLYEQLKHA
jgi:glycosyltransferase involved in cell wall biosynthesis